MEVFHNVNEVSREIRNAIRRYGHFAEHNFVHYKYCENSSDKNVFFRCGSNKGVLMQFDEKNNIWSLFPCGVLAPEEERLDLFLDAARYVLKKKKAKKFTAEVSENIRQGLLKKMRTPNSMKVRSYLYTLYWPMYNMKEWDPKLRGSRMKKLRNIRNRFHKKYKVSVRNSRDVPKDKLREMVDRWIEKRSMNDEIDKDYYLNIIDNNFRGIDIAKTMYVNGKPATITAGWRIPNTNNYYSAIGVIDYSYPGLGEASNIDDLNRLKRLGFDYADFGGSDKVLLQFKKKFKPEKIYKTYTFSMVMR